MNSTEVIALAKKLESSILTWRQHFHAHPELSFCEFETSRYIVDRLTEFGCENIKLGCYGRATGVIADVIGAFPGKCVALRADIDALPIQEESGVEFTSQNDGVMHACGHDSHAAMLLGAAKILCSIKDRLHGTVRLIFQPSEESDDVSLGAPRMIEEGALDGVDAIFGVHVVTQYDAGMFLWRSGGMMACSDIWKVIIHGKGGHGASPHETHDPMIAGAQLITALQTFVSRELDPLESAVISVGMLRAGSAFNIIPGEVYLEGTARAFSSTVSQNVEEFIRRMATNIASAFRCSAEVFYTHNTPPVVNDPEMAEFGAETARQIFGGENVAVLTPTMPADDYSFFLEKVPGAYFNIGVRNPEIGADWPHHHCRFKIDESPLWKGSAFEALAACNFLDS